MSTASPAVEKYFAEFDRVQKEYLEDLYTFLRFPSISTEAEFQPDVIKCHDWLCDYMKGLGFTVESWPTSGHPVIFASWMNAPGKATTLYYNHYDVQPVDPLNLWVSKPFEPTMRDGRVYARGAQDNKGQLFYVLRALGYLLKRDGKLPTNVKLCIEGEEEHGSAGLRAILPSKREQLKADHVYVWDVGFMDENAPAINVGVRGLVTMTVEMQGSTGDLHSGTFGGIVYNPNRAMCELLGSMWDKEGRVLIPGFYDDVLEVNEDEMKALNFHFDHDLLDRLFKAKATGGEKAYTPFQSAWIRPALEINGVGGGYFGSGFKTVIPAKTVAKISARIVPNQDPVKLGKQIAKFLTERAPEGISVHVEIEPGVGKPMRSSLSSAVVKATAKAYEEVNGQVPSYILDGASIPIGAELVEAAGGQLIFAGYGLPTDNLHAPNENFSITQMRKGFATVCRSLELLG